MPTPILSIREIIEMVPGGAEAIAKASRSTDLPIGVEAVFKWRKNGIPDGHWPLVMRLADLPLDVIYSANQRVKRKKRREKRNSESSSEHRAA